MPWMRTACSASGLSPSSLTAVGAIEVPVREVIPLPDERQRLRRGQVQVTGMLLVETRVRVAEIAI